MTTDITKTDGNKNQLKKLLDDNRGAIAKLIPKHLDADRLLQLAISVYTKQPKLRECSTLSVLGAVVHCVSIGLEPNSPLGEIFILPFHNSNEGKTEATVIHGYPGLLKLVDQVGYFKDISVNVVYQSDDFSYKFGKDADISHTPSMIRAGDIVAFWAGGNTTRGGYQFEVCPKAFVDGIRARAPSKNSPAWQNDYAQMGKKTALKQLLKWVPKSANVARALALEGKAEAGETQNLESLFENTGGTTIEGAIEPESPALAQGAAPEQAAPKPAAKPRGRPPAPEPEQQEPVAQNEVPAAQQAPAAEPLSFDSWMAKVDAAGADDLDDLEDAIRGMKPTIQGLARREIERRRNEVME